MPPVPGWYGKIPALGDFASRRLPQGFIDIWHDWLQRGMIAGRTAWGERWLDLYLNSPIWRFVLLPGVCGESAWAGTLMPSVDKVGRYFPLTIAVQTSASVPLLSLATAMDEWYERLEQLSLAMLNVSVAAEDLEQGLASAPFPLTDAEEPSSARELAWWWTNANGVVKHADLGQPPAVSSLLQDAAMQVFTSLGGNKTLWWATGQANLLCFNGLPSASAFSFLLGNQAD